MVAAPISLRCMICGGTITSRLGRVVCSTHCRARFAGQQNRNHHSDSLRAELARLWQLVPRISTAEIGRRLRVTKNVVVSLRRRMGLEPRATPFPNKLTPTPAATPARMARPGPWRRSQCGAPLTEGVAAGVSFPSPCGDFLSAAGNSAARTTHPGAAGGAFSSQDVPMDGQRRSALGVVWGACHARLPLLQAAPRTLLGEQPKAAGDHP